VTGNPSRLVRASTAWAKPVIAGVLLVLLLLLGVVVGGVVRVLIGVVAGGVRVVVGVESREAPLPIAGTFASDMFA
jgi:hypothetical protein